MSDGQLSAQQLANLTPQLDSTFSTRSAAALAGDRAARLEVIQTCREYLLFIANQELDARLQPKCGPSDVVQNTLVKAVEHFDDFEGKNQQALLGWLRRILVNEIADVRRAFLTSEKRNIRRENSSDGDPNWAAARLAVVDSEDTPASRAAVLEDVERLQRALQRLSPDHESVIRMRNWERLSFADIGERMGRSEAAAKKLWARALSKLKDVIPENE